MWVLFWRVHVPLARPAIVSLGILMSVWTWNQFILALILVDDPKQRTVAGALGAFQGQWGTDIPLLSAGSILILLPVAHRVRDLPAPGHHRPAPGLGEGLTRRIPDRQRSLRVSSAYQTRDGIAVHGDVEDGYGPVVDEFVRNFDERHDLGSACTVYVDGRQGRRPVGRHRGPADRASRSSGTRPR